MCGQCGVYSTSFGTADQKLFEFLLFLNVQRGRDSTGIIRVDEKPNRNDGFHLHEQKTILASPQFLASDSCKILTEPKTRPVLMMGHTRAATRGKVSLKNAHPFSFKNVSGTHNGTIKRSFEDSSKYETDSEGLYHLIDKYGIEKALNEVNDWDSAYALQFVEQRGETPMTLNFIRNDARPLHFCWGFGKNTLVWSSEQLTLRYAMDVLKHNMKGWDDKNDCWTLKKNQLMQLTVGEAAEKVRLESIEIEEKKRTYSTYSYPAYTGDSDYTGTSTQTATNNGGSNPKPGSWVQIKPGVRRFMSWEAQKKLASAQTENSTKNETASGSHPKSPATKGLSKSPEGYAGYKKKYTQDGLEGLKWLKESEPFDATAEQLDCLVGLPALEDLTGSAKDSPPWDDVNDERVLFVKGFQGSEITEREMRFRLDQGCFWCNQVFNMDDPHDFFDINNLHWYNRENWACHECYTNSTGDVVKEMVEDGLDVYVSDSPQMKKG